MPDRPTPPRRTDATAADGPERAGRGRLAAVAVWSVVVAVGVATFAIGRMSGGLAASHCFWAAVLAASGSATLLRPEMSYALDAPRWWFSAQRPAPSTAYLVVARVSGAAVLAGSVLYVWLSS